MWVSQAAAVVSMRDGEIPPEVGLLLRPLSLLIRGVKAKAKWCLSRSSWHGKNSTHIFSGWWQWWVSIGLAIPVGHPQLFSSWFSSPLDLQQDGNATNPPGRSGSGSLLRHLSSFPWSWRAVLPQQPHGEEAEPPAAASPFSPAAAGML